MNTKELNIDKDIKVIVPDHKNLKDFAEMVNNEPGAIDLYKLEMERSNVPTRQVLDESRNVNRTATQKGTGLYQIAQRAERMALREGLIAYAATLKMDPDELAYMVDYLPNARIGYLNTLIKRALSGIANNTLTIHQADIDYIQNMRVLNVSAKATLLQLLTMALDKTKDNFSVQPPVTRSGIPIYDAKGLQSGSYIKLRNPGNVYLPLGDGNAQEYHPTIDISLPLIKLIQRMDQKLVKAMDDLEVAKDHGELLLYGNDKSELNKVLLSFMDKLSDRHLTIKELRRLGDRLHDLISLKRSKYFLSLAQPWKHRTARVPAMISPASATFSIRSIVPLTTNATGNVAFVVNPYFLEQASQPTNSTVGVNNFGTLTGAAANANFNSVIVGQVLPADFYVRYRLVSSGLKLYCYPSSNNDNGIATISVTFESINKTGSPSPIAGATQFGDFNQIENGYYKQTTTVASREVQEHVYIPIDDSFLDYQTLGIEKTGFSWVGYVSGAAPSTTIARLELIANFEALLDNQYTDYLPSDVPDDEADPKHVPIMINKMKRVDVLNPKNLNDVLTEENLSFNPDEVLLLPVPQAKVKQADKQVKELTQEIGEALKEFMPSIPKESQNSWLSNIMDTISPIASTIVQQVASRIFPPLPYFGKF